MKSRSHWFCSENVVFHFTYFVHVKRFSSLTFLVWKRIMPFAINLFPQTRANYNGVLDFQLENCGFSFSSSISVADNIVITATYISRLVFWKISSPKRVKQKNFDKNRAFFFQFSQTTERFWHVQLEFFASLQLHNLSKQPCSPNVRRQGKVNRLPFGTLFSKTLIKKNSFCGALFYLPMSEWNSETWKCYF